MGKIISWFPGNWPFAPSRKQYFLDSGYTPVSYEPEHIKTAEALLLNTPVRDENGTLISPEEVWKNYLLKENPSIRIIQVGLDGTAPTANYLHWNRRTENFATFLKGCKSVGDGWVPHRTYGEPLGDKWTLFRDGHDKGGFMDWFVVAFRRSSIVYQILSAKTEAKAGEMQEYLNEENTVTAFENLVKRWNRYEPLLMTAPCSKELQHIATNINKIEKAWQGRHHWKNLEEGAGDLVLTLRAIEKLLKKMDPWFKTELRR